MKNTREKNGQATRLWKRGMAGLTASILLVSPAFAATQKAKAKSKKAAPAIVKAIAPAAAPAPMIAAAPPVVSAPAAGTSTAVVAAPAAKSPLGRFGLTYTADTRIESEAINRLGSSQIGEEGYKAVTTNIVGINYKLSDTEKVAIKQYFDKGLGPKAADGVDVTWLVAQYSTKMKGILGSDEIAPLFWYYIPTAANTTLGNGLDDGRILHNGIFRLDAEVAWTLTPKWTVSYYFNPRQSLVPGEQLVYEKNDKTGKFEVSSVKQSTTILLQYGYLYYNVNDKFQPYAALGFRHDFLNNDGGTNSLNAGFPVVGMNYTFNKNFILNAEINQDGVNGVPFTKTSYSGTNRDDLVRSTKQINNSQWLDSHNFNYEVVLALSI